MFNYYLYKAATNEKYKLSSLNRDIDISEEVLGETTQLYRGHSVRDILPDGIKRKVSIKWSWLPHRDVDVLDGGIGFLTLLNLWRYNKDSGLLIFEKPNQDGTKEVFRCRFDDTTTAEMERRDTASPPNNSLFWHLELVLVEE